MKQYETISVVLLAAAVGISLIAVFVAGRANSLNKNTFRRQGVIDLNMAWQGVNEVNKDNLVVPDIVRGVNDFALMASLWNHDVIERNILYQTYWEPCKRLYEQLYFNDLLVPSHNRACKSLITTEIQKAYEQMKKVDLDKVTQTKL